MAQARSFHEVRHKMLMVPGLFYMIKLASSEITDVIYSIVGLSFDLFDFLF